MTNMRRQFMLADSKAFSGFAAPDIEAARDFYRDKLGLDVTEQEVGGQSLLTLNLAGDRPTMIYPKPDFQPATYTVLNFPVDDVEAAVDELSARGVQFEKYDGFDQDRRASPAETVRISHGSRTPPGTSSLCSSPTSAAARRGRTTRRSRSRR